MFQTNRTFGDTKWFYFEVKMNSTRMVLHHIADSGIVSEGRNVHLETTFSTSRQTTLNWKYSKDVHMTSTALSILTVFPLQKSSPRINYTEKLS